LMTRTTHTAATRVTSEPDRPPPRATRLRLLCARSRGERAGWGGVRRGRLVRGVERDELFSFLFGDVLGISVSDMVALIVLVVALLLVIRALWKELLFATFDPLGAGAAGLPVRRLDDLLLILIAVTIVISLQAVGIVLVVAMITTPAATAQLLVKRFGQMIGVAALIGVTAAVAGLYLSYALDLASGAAIVLFETALFLVVLLVTSLRGRRTA
jgi:manganese/iron transport system permease protein